MTRAAGMVVVRMSATRARALAGVIRSIVIDEPTILGAAALGLFTAQDLASFQDERRSRLELLAGILDPQVHRRGRPRAAVSLYQLPRSAVEEFEESVRLHLVPRRLRPAAVMLSRSCHKRLGRRPLTGTPLANRLRIKQAAAEYGEADERHVRRLRVRLRREQDDPARRQSEIEKAANRRRGYASLLLTAHH